MLLAAELKDALALEAADEAEEAALAALPEADVAAAAPVPVEVALPLLALEVQVAEAGKSDEAETGSQMLWAYAKAAAWSALSHAWKTQQPMLSRKEEVWQMQLGSRLQLAGRRLVTQLLAHDGSVAPD